MKPASAKAKGRKLQQHGAGDIRTVHNLPDPDAVSTSMGKTGMDIMLSSAAREVFPYAVECKCVEKLNVWEALEQAEANAKEERLNPLLLFTRNRAELYSAVRWDHFLELTRIVAEAKRRGIC